MHTVFGRQLVGGDSGAEVESEVGCGQSVLRELYLGIGVERDGECKEQSRYQKARFHSGRLLFEGAFSAHSLEHFGHKVDVVLDA